MGGCFGAFSIRFLIGCSEVGFLREGFLRVISGEGYFEDGFLGVLSEEGFSGILYSLGC